MSNSFRNFTLFVVGMLTVFTAIAQETVVLAAEDDWYPYTARNKNGTADGRSVDIITAAYKAAGVKLELVVVPFNRGMLLTKAGKYAGVFNAGLTSEDLKRDYLVPDHTIGVSEQVVVGRTGESFSGLSSFNGRKLALTTGYTYPKSITDDQLNIVEYANTEISNLKKLASFRADFTVGDRLVFKSLLRNEPALKQRLAFLGETESTKLYVLFSKTEKGYRARELFDIGMDKINREGKLKDILKKWEEKLK